MAANKDQAEFVMGKLGYARAMAQVPKNAKISPITAPIKERTADSARKRRRTCPPRAPIALSSPISVVRWETAISITFMIKIPATARLIAAIPATVSVSVVKILSKVESRASCVMTVMSSSPSCHVFVFLVDVPPQAYIAINV